MSISEELARLREEMEILVDEMKETRAEGAKVRETLATHAEKFKHPCEVHGAIDQRLTRIETKQNGFSNALKTWLPYVIMASWALIMFLIERSHLP